MICFLLNFSSNVDKLSSPTPHPHSKPERFPSLVYVRSRNPGLHFGLVNSPLCAHSKSIIYLYYYYLFYFFYLGDLSFD